MTPRRSTRATRPGDARAYTAKAKEFLDAAASSLQAGSHVAAVGNAVHAAIAAADAITAARGGAVWRGEHDQAPAHLERLGGDQGRRAARHLRSVLPLKSRAEYDPDPMTASQAQRAVQAAQRIVAIADQVLRD